MLDLNSIPVVDNHCHPILLEQHMDALTFRSYFSEAQHPSFAEKHLPNTIYYQWLLRQLAAISVPDALRTPSLRRATVRALTICLPV